MSRKHKQHRASEQARMRAEAQQAPTFEPWQLRGRARSHWIESLTHQLFAEQGGACYDRIIRSGLLTLEAFESQMQHAKDGVTKAWGPDVSVYEARMNRALVDRTMRERRAALREIRQRLERALDDEIEMHAQAADQAEAEEAVVAAGTRESGELPRHEDSALLPAHISQTEAGVLAGASTG